MKDIEFRGMNSITKKWVYSNGYYFDGNNYWFLIPKKTNKAIAFAHNIEVQEITIGQYIEMKDVHQNKVFQGDIVRVTRFTFEDCHRKEIEGMEQYVGEVVWHQFGWHIAEKMEHSTRYHSLWLWNVKDDETDPNTHFMEILGDKYINQVTSCINQE